MNPRRYFFHHTATVAAQLAEVSEVLLDLEHYPDWWPQVRAVASLGPEDALVVCRSTLPYDLELHLTARSRTPTRLEVAIDGPFAGYARWELRPDRNGTHLEFSQDVEVTSNALTIASYVLRPLLILNHRAMMRGCTKGLTSRFAAPVTRGARTDP